MRVLWLVRRNLTDHPGGDTVQILQTAQALRDRGIAIEMHYSMPDNLSGYDLAHLFHLDRLWENRPHADALSRAGLPMVLSTIYWPTEEFDRHGRTGWQGRLARVTGTRGYRDLWLAQRWGMHALREPSMAHFRRPLWRFRHESAALLRHARVILPNSDAERRAIASLFGVERPCVVVPNAVDLAALGSPENSTGRERRGVLCVGRIEPRKNQLNLIRAMRASDIPLTLAGQAGRFSGAYGRRCQREAGPTTHFVGHQSPSVLGTLYARNAVHACVSWYETPGLVNLEAACFGCAIVATPGGSTREYLGDEAVYADPGVPDSIREAVQAAMARGPSSALDQRIRAEFTWANAAERTWEGYQRALSGSS